MRPLLKRLGASLPLLCVAEYSISAAAIAIFSLGFIILGTICGLLSFRKKRDYLLRPASMFYAFAGKPRAPVPVPRVWADALTSGRGETPRLHPGAD